MTFEWKHPKYYAELKKLRREQEAKEEEESRETEETKETEE